MKHLLEKLKEESLLERWAIRMTLIGILAAHLLMLVKLKFTAWPEMLLWPYLMTHGWMPYKDIAIAHTPLLLFDLSIFYALFSSGIMQLKIYTWILILSTDVLVYWVSEKLWSKRVAIIAVSVFAFWQVFFDGNGLWFDLAMGPLALLTFYFLEKKKYLLAGVIWTLTFLTKQTAFWFLIPIAVTLLVSNKDRSQRIYKFVCGVLIILATFLLTIFLLNIHQHFFNWAIQFGIFELPKATGQIQLPDLKKLLISGFPFLILLLPFLTKTKSNWLILVWAMVGVFGAYPRFEYFHFQPSVPFLAIGSAIAVQGFNKSNKLLRFFIIFYLLGSLYLFANFFMRNYGEGTRFYEKGVTEISSYIVSNTNEGDRIFVLNYWDNLYTLSNTLPASDPWIPQLSWYMELPGIQEKIVKNLQDSKPTLILINPYTQTGLSSYKPKLIYDYVVANYKLKDKVGGVEILVPR